MQIGPISVQSVEAEYALLNSWFPGGYQRTLQSLASDRSTGRTYDRLDVVAGGRSYTVWFDITSFMNLSSRAAVQPAGQQAVGQTCPTQECPRLPSSESAYKLWQGDGEAFVLLMRDLVFRGVLIGAGMYLAGERDHLVRNALAGSAMIEFFVLGWIAFTTGQRQTPAAGARVAQVRKYPWQPVQQLAA